MQTCPHCGQLMPCQPYQPIPLPTAAAAANPVRLVTVRLAAAGAYVPAVQWLWREC